MILRPAIARLPIQNGFRSKKTQDRAESRQRRPGGHQGRLDHKNVRAFKPDLNLLGTAESVEMEKQRELLEKQGCKPLFSHTGRNGYREASTGPLPLSHNSTGPFGIVLDDVASSWLASP